MTSIVADPALVDSYNKQHGTDKLKRSQVPKHLKEIRTELQMDKETPIFPFSALSKQGRDEIWDFIESMVLKQEEAE